MPKKVNLTAETDIIRQYLESNILT